MVYIKAIGIYIPTFLSAVGRSVSGGGSITTEPLHRAIKSQPHLEAKVRRWV